MSKVTRLKAAGASPEPDVDVGALVPFPEPMPPRRWLVPGFLMYGTVAIVAGKGGEGKSLFSMQCALAVSSGAPFFWWGAPEEPATVLILNGEDDRAEQQRRLMGAARLMGLEPGDRLLSASAPQGIALFRQEIDKAGKKIRVRTRLFQRLEEEIAARGVKLLVVDPLIETNDGFDESGNNDMKAVVVELRVLARRHDLAVLVVDHSRKGAAGGDQDDVRGAGAKVNAARRVVTLSRVPEDEASKMGATGERRTRIVRVGDAKANYAGREGERFLELVPTKLPNGDWVAPFRVAEDLGAIDEGFDLRGWEHFAVFLELVRAGCDGRPWARSFQSSTARLDREMADRFRISEDRAKEIIKAAARRGVLVEEQWRDDEQRKDRAVWGVAAGAELPDVVPF